MKTFARKSLLVLCLCAPLVAVAVPPQNPGQPPVVMNATPPGTPPPSAATCPPANQNNIYDPRVPPAGAYYVKNPDGSGQQVFTTGEKKPYITDNNCGGGSTPAVFPQVYTGAPY